MLHVKNMNVILPRCREVAASLDKNQPVHVETVNQMKTPAALIAGCMPAKASRKLASVKTADTKQIKLIHIELRARARMPLNVAKASVHLS